MKFMGILGLHNGVNQFLYIPLLLLFLWRILTNTKAYYINTYNYRVSKKRFVNHGKRRWIRVEANFGNAHPIFSQGIFNILVPLVKPFTIQGTHTYI